MEREAQRESRGETVRSGGEGDRKVQEGRVHGAGKWGRREGGRGEKGKEKEAT